MIAVLVLELLFGTTQMEVKLPFTSSHSAVWLSAVSLLFHLLYYHGGTICVVARLVLIKECLVIPGMTNDIFVCYLQFLTI